MSDLHEGKAPQSAKEDFAAAVAAGRLPLFLDARERARLMAETAREELELDAAEPGGPHAQRAAAYASLAVYERMEAAEMYAEYGPDAYEKLYLQVAKSQRSAERFDRIEAAMNRFEAWAQRTIGDRVDRWGEAYEQALRKRGL